MKILLVLVAIVGITSAGDHKELLEKFGLIKILESCFGKDLLKQKLHQFYDHAASCRKEGNAMKPPTSIRKAFDWEAVFNEKTPLFLPVPFVSHGFKSPFDFNHRQKRHVIFNEQKLRELKNKVLEKMKLAACILQRMNILDANLTIQWSNLEHRYNELDVEPALKEDLLDVFKTCKNKVSCLPLDEKKIGTFPVGLKQAFYFFKCEKKYKIEACIKKDLRTKVDMFELQGLDGLFDHFEDDDDKMFKVMKLFHKYGDDDMALFD